MPKIRDFLEHLTNTWQNRRAAALGQAYMASPDDSSVLAHADVADLFDIVENNWQLFESGIGLRKDVWDGRTRELRPIRHRIAHCRRPHNDDAYRIEQLLRDLEVGANRSLRSYVDFRPPRKELPDPIIVDWLQGKHVAAQRLLQHGATNKGIHFHLEVSVRPWADLSGPLLTGTPGVYWVMTVSLDDRHLYIDDYWNDGGVQRSIDFIGHVIQCSDTLLHVTFPAIEAAADLTEAIAQCFEAVFRCAHPGYGNGSIRRPWGATNLEFDSRVDAGGLLAILSGLNGDDSISFFSAAKA